MSLSDPRWQRLHDESYTCACCGQSFNGLQDIAFDRPEQWPADQPAQLNSDLASAAKDGRDILTEDFCVMGQHRFLRAILPMQIIGTPETFSLGVWGTIGPQHFMDVLQHFDPGTQGQLGPYGSWLGNHLPGADLHPPKARLQMHNDRQRPHLILEDDTHPFFAYQRDGITFDQVLDIFAHFGNDLRPHLDG